MEASLIRQGKAQQDSLAEAIRAQTLAMEAIARRTELSFGGLEHSLELLTEDTNLNARAIAGLEGFLRNPESGYTAPPSPARRVHRRRKEDAE